MQVEVTLENIIAFNLVELTGNSAETLLKRAKEAEEAGYILAVEIPDDKIDMNVFQHGVDVRPADPDLQPGDGQSPYGSGQTEPASGRRIDVEVVEGEVIDSREDNA